MKSYFKNFPKRLARNMRKEPVVINIFKWLEEPIRENQLTLEELLSSNSLSMEPVFREFLSG